VIAIDRATCVFAIAMVVAAASPAAAEPWSLAVDGECAGADAFRARTDAQRVRAGEIAGVGIRVAITGADPRWHVRVAVVDGAGHETVRELDGESCAAATDAATLIVAQLLDGLAPAPPPPPDPGPHELAPIPGTDEAPRAPSLAEPVSIRIGAALGADFGSLPAATPGARVVLEVGWWRAVGSLGVARWREVTELDAQGEGFSASAWQAHAALRIRVSRAVELGPQVEIGQLAARGRGVDTVLAASGAWQAVGAVGRVRLWTRGRLEVALQIEALAALAAPTFVVDGEPRYHPTSAVRALISAGWTLFDGSSGLRP
jgi:hypothetical protein